MIASVAVAIIAVLGVAVFVTTRGKDELTPIAQEACDDLENAIMLQVGGILGGAISDAEDAGYSAIELGDRMRETCPGTMRALDAFLDEQATEDLLPSEIDLDITSCGSDEVKGTVVNESGERVDIFIEITFENAAGVQVGDSVASVIGLRPGQRANWDASVFEDYDTCRARVSSAYVSE